ncbi:autotransporter-associated beta strand repeat-containing protein [Prosthecobacter dejongeii]|uniref:Putative delta-60 repeat protein n=1 Tax=Prosthecobacter dejongeii TaxID=48465 RepID=A0A7W8DR91_9BACT|nr:autotransporter-associated beta strand repeat-containing protein [Prosthecobacter dejongeii]MBB5038661.1 putative delta-60 repeat protein [Prosthecobacter dejongeii]
MKTNSASPGVFRKALRLSSALSLLVATPGLVLGQTVPPFTLKSLDGFSTLNANGSWVSPASNFHQTFAINATATATRATTGVNANRITAIALTSRGAGYTSVPTVIIGRGTGDTTGTGATAVATITPEGHVDTVTLTNMGSNYTATPTVTISPTFGGSGSTVHFNADITANRILTLDGNRTVGTMFLGDLSNGSSYTIAQGTEGSLIFDNDGNGGGAFLNRFNGVTTDVISAPVRLDDWLNFRATTGRLTISGAISGNGNAITSYGNGILSLTGNNSQANTGSKFDLRLWNRGTTNTGAQVELGATAGNAVGGNIYIGNATLGTSGHAVLQLLAGRSHLDQISNDATLTFDSFSGSGRNNYFKLLGGSETVGRILDLGSLAVIENRESETIGTAATLTLSSNADSYVTGFIRDNSGNNLQQADQLGSPGANALAIVKQGTGEMTLQGGNIIFTGGLTVSGGTTILRQATNFRSDVVNNGTLVFDNTGTWNFTKTFTDPDGAGSNAQLAPAQKNLLISGSGNVVKDGTGILNLGASATENHSIGGSLTVNNGTLNLAGGGAGLGSVIGGALLVNGDSGLNRNVGLQGRTSIDGGIRATGRYNAAGSTLSVGGTVLTQGDQLSSTWQDGLSTITGDINLQYMNMRVESSFNINKTSSAATSSGNTVTVTQSASLVVGMRVTGNGVPADTVVTAIDPVTRVVTLSKSASVPGNTTLNFAYSTNTDGVINEFTTSLATAATTMAQNSSTLNVGSSPAAAGLKVGMRISHPNLPAGTTILAINEALGQVTLSNPASAAITASAGTPVAVNGLNSINISGRPNAIGVAANSGGLYLNNTRFSNNANRIPDGTTIKLNGGVVEFVNDASANTFSEQLGPLTLGSGQGQITSFQAPVGSTSTLRFASLTRQPGGVVEFAGREATLGSSTVNTVTDALGTTTRNRIFFNSGVTLDDNIIGGWAFANNEFVKYGANGVTRLLSTDYTNTTDANGQNTWLFNANAKFQGTASFTTITTNARRAVNSLSLQPDLSAAAAGRAVNLGTGFLLSVESGGILASHGGHTINGSDTAYLTVGTPKNTPAELFAITGTFNNTPASLASLTISAPVRDFNLEFNGQGAVNVVTMPAGSNQMTIPAGTAPVLMVGMEVTHANLPAGTVITAVDRSQTGVTTITLNNAPISGALAAATATPVRFNGGSVSFVKAGPGTVVMHPTFQNTYTGRTVINNGILRLRANTNLGPAPSTFSADHLLLNGGTLQFGRDTVTGTPGVTLPDFEYTLTDANRGITFGNSGGRLEVGHQNPTPYILPGAANNNVIQEVNLTVTSPIQATGVVELAVRATPTFDGVGSFNTLNLGNNASTNNYGGGIKTEGGFDGNINIYGNNNVNGLFMEGARVQFYGNNNFSGDIRVLSGNLTLSGNNTYNGTNNFSDTITLGTATLTLSSANALGTAGFKVILGDNSRLRFNGTNQTLLSLTGAANASISNGYSPAEGTSDPQLPSVLTVDLPINETYAGLLNNGGSSELRLLKKGPGRLSLTGTESEFSGNVTIEEGVLDIATISFAGGRSSLGTGSNGAASEIVIDGGGLSFSPRGQQFTNRSITIGEGPDAATLVANGVNQAARVILGSSLILFPGQPNEESLVSERVGMLGNGPRTLTLSGVNTGDNEFQLQLSDKSATAATSLLKIGPGTWGVGTAGDFSGQVTVQEGVLAVLANGALGTPGIPTTVLVSPVNKLTGRLPNGTEVTFPRMSTTIFPQGMKANTRYYVVESDKPNGTFKIATTPGGTAVNLVALTRINEDFEEVPILPFDVTYVPNVQAVASTYGDDATDTFTGNLLDGSVVNFSFGLLYRNPVTNQQVASSLPGNIFADRTYYVINATGTTFQVALDPNSTTPVLLTSNSSGNIIYTASGPGISTSGVNVIGGRLDLRNVDYMLNEEITFQGGALSMPANNLATWSGNVDVQANTTFTIGANSEFILDGNILGARAITQLGEGTVRLRGETIQHYIPNVGGGTGQSEMENFRRTYTVQAGTLILDYSQNNNSKLVDLATLTLGGGRRGGIIRLQGGTTYHEEIINNLSLQAGANEIYRDSGTNTLRLNAISRAEGASLYFDLARIATVDNLNINGILGGWAIIRDAVVQASWTIRGTVSRNFAASTTTDVLSVPLAQGVHYLINGSPVRLTTVGTLPAPLETGVTYYVVSASTRSFKLALTPDGTPIDITSTGTAGSNQHTVSAYQPQRPGAATLVFTANPDVFPGALGTDVFSVKIENTGVAGNITSTINVPPQITPATPLTYVIRTTTTRSSANDIVAFVNGTDTTIRNYLSVTASGSDSLLDAATYGPQLLQGGSNDNGSQSLGWARNSSNSLDGLVQVLGNTSYLPNSWGENGNTNVTGNLPVGEGSITYTLRYATNAPSITTLSGGDEFGGISTLQTGSILVSPTVGANDSSIVGTGSLATRNEGNLRDFLIHQYNEDGDFIIGVPLLNRGVQTRRGRLTAGNPAVLSGISDTTGLLGATVSVVPGQTNILPANATVVQVLDANTVVLSGNTTNSADARVELIFTVAGNPIRRFVTTQNTTTQNRINGVVNPETGLISTSDIYIGMPISGPGIPAGAIVDAIFNDSDIRINANHFFNAELYGVSSTFTLTPSVGLQKLGGGTLILDADNTYTGVTFLADGVLRAQKLTDAGVAGSLGLSATGNPAGNLVFNGGTLQYIGENSSTNRAYTITDFARFNVGHEKTTAIFSGNFNLSGTIGASDRLEKVGSGTLELRGSGGLNEVKVEEGVLRMQLVDTNASAGGFAISNPVNNNLANVRLSGGMLEVRGLPEANSSLTMGGAFIVDEGASEVRVTNVAGFDPVNLRAGPISTRTTTVNFMGGEETTSVQRLSGGTVRFTENPELNSGSANIFLNIPRLERTNLLAWAVYQNLSAAGGTVGVDDFASVLVESGGVVSADFQTLYQLGSNHSNAALWGISRPSTIHNPSEGGAVQIDIPSGVTITAGSKDMVISAVQQSLVNTLLVDMMVTGPGIPADTRIVSLNKTTRVVTLNNAAELDSTVGNYRFLTTRTLFGRVGLVDPGQSESASINIAGRDREVNTLRYYSPEDSVVTVDAGSTLKLVSGAILVASNVRTGEKSILGPGNISSTGVAGEGSDFIIHNYSQHATFNIGANIIDGVVVLEVPQDNAPAVPAGSVLEGQSVMTVLELAFKQRNRIHPGMEISGPGIQPGTFVLSVDGLLSQIFMSKPATGTFTGVAYTFRSSTSLVQSGIGTTILSGNNIYSGKTFVHGGVLRLDSANAIPGGFTSTAPLATSSHIVVKDGVIGLSSGDFTRFLGTADNQIEFKGSGGFAAYGADRLVNFGNEGKRLRFGNDGFVSDGSSLILGAVDATHKVTLVNPIDLGSYSQAVRVNNGPAAIEGELSGILSGAGKLIKFGQGSLRLSGSNAHTGGIEIAEGRLVVANVPNALGTGTGPGTGAVALGTSQTNTSKSAGLELTVEGGTVAKDITVGEVNARGPDWLGQGRVDTKNADAGSFSSTAMVNGAPAIAYYDATNQDLKYVRAADARGTTWLPPITLASRGDVGKYVSLAVVNGTPAVSYYDATNGTLCYMRASDTSGAFWAPSVIADANPVSSVAVQSTGAVIVGGTFVEFDGVARTRLARLSPTGVLDTNFNVIVNGEVRAIAIQADDSIIIAGAFTRVTGSGAGQTETVRNNIARLTSAGALDTGYNPNSNGAIRVLLRQADGNLLVGGSFSNIGGAGRNNVARLIPAGTADSFNPNANGEVRALAVQTDNHVLIGGAFTTLGGSTRNRMGRVDAAGALQAFNPNFNNEVRGIAVAADGKIYVGGLFSTVVGTPNVTTFTRNRLARLLADGAVDITFGVEVNAEVRSVQMLSTGKVAVLGIFSVFGKANANFMAQLNADGSEDQTFAPDPDYEVRALVEQSDGKLVIGGLFSNVGGGTQHYVGRLNANGTRDASFLRKVTDRGQYTSLASVEINNPIIGVPGIAYYDVVESDLRFVRSSDVNGTNWIPSLLLDSSGGQGTSMATVNIGGDVIVKNFTNSTASISGFANNGTPGIAYYDQATGELRYMLANNSGGDDWTPPKVLRNIGVGVGQISLTAVNGTPAIAYYNNTTGDLEYMRASSFGGITTDLRISPTEVQTKAIAAIVYTSTFGTPDVLDSTGTVGQFPSLAVVNGLPVTAAGTPAVAYYDATNKKLKYIRATNATGVREFPGDPFPWNTPITLLQSVNDIGRNAGLVMMAEVPGVSYRHIPVPANPEELPSIQFVHISDAAGYSKLSFTANTTLSGNLNLDGTALVAPESGSTLTLNGNITGAGGFRLNTDGTMIINSTDNNFGTGLSEEANGNSRVTIRSGSLLLGSSTALGINTGTVQNPWYGRVDLGDRNGNPINNSFQIAVVRSTTGGSLTALAGSSFTTGSGNAGTFVNVSNVLDGRTFTQADTGALVLVKDEQANSARNGVYRVVITAQQTAGTMNLVRAVTLDELAEFTYGLRVQVQGGTEQNETYFLASLVQEVNTSPVVWAQVLTVDRATTGYSLTRVEGRFDPTHNGLFSNAGGPGAFVEVDTLIDGRIFTEADTGTLILVKDEENNPAWNGVYRIIYSAGLQLNGTLNLVRAPEFDTVAEMTYGTQVRVTNGTHAGQAFFLASNVSGLNTTPVLWTRDVADANIALRTAVSGLTISQAIDVNARVGAGSMSLGSATALTSGTAEFTGNITLRDNQRYTAENQSLNLDSNLATGYGVKIRGNITEARGTAGSDSGGTLPADSLSLVKTGTGVVSLYGNDSTFHGGVTVNQGTLLVMNTAGSATGTGTVQVNAGAVLGGVGFIGGPVQLTGTGTEISTRATLRVGDPTVTTGNEVLTLGGPLTVGPNSVVEFALGAGNLNRLAGTSINLTETGRLLVSMAPGYNPGLNTTFDILDLSGGITFSQGGQVTLSDYLKLPGQYLWDTSTFLTTGSITITGLTDDVQVDVPPAAVTVNPGAGTTVNFSVTVSGSPEFVYQWQFRQAGAPDYVNIGTAVRASAFTNTFTKTGIFEADEGDYRVMVTNGDGAFTATSAPAYLTVNNPPVIIVQPTPQTVNPNATATFTVQVNGPTPYSFVWRRGTVPITLGGRFSVVSDAQTGLSTLTITGVVKADETNNINVVVSNLAGSAAPSNFVSLLVTDPVTIVNQPLNSQVSTGDIAFFTVSATGTAPISYQWQRREVGGVFEDIVGETENTLRIPGITADDDNDEIRVRVTNPAGTVDSVVVSIDLVPGAPSIVSPGSTTLVQGSTLELTSRVGGATAGRVVVWKRNNAVITAGERVNAGVTSKVSILESFEGNTLITTLRIENITTALAGEFKVEAKNTLFPKPVTSVAGTGLVVVANNPNVDVAASNKPKTKATMTVIAAGPAKGVTIGYQWMRLVDGNYEAIPPSDIDFVGVLTKTLTINNVDIADRGTYACKVTGAGTPSFVMAGTHHLKVYTAEPELLPITFPVGMVGADYEYQIPVDLGTDGDKTPALYSISGLPPGLKADSKTGKITGRPTASKVGGYAVKVTVSNAFSSKPNLQTATATLTVNAIPTGGVGTFAGWIPRHELNGEVGGRFDLVVTAQGAFSGKVTLATTVYPIKGNLKLVIDPETGLLTADPEGTVTILRKAVGAAPVPPPLTLAFTLKPNTDRLGTASISTSEQRIVDNELVVVDLNLPFTGWRNKWSATVPPNDYLSDLVAPAVKKTPGYYTMALSPPDASAAVIPQGDGFAAFTVGVTGTLSYVGKTADGQAITGAQFVGPLGEVIMFQTLYKTTPRGSLVGEIKINKVNDAIFADNTITSSPATAPTWTCPANLLASNRTYRNGFGPISLTVNGGAYLDPNRKKPTPTSPDYPLIFGLLAPTVDALDLKFYLNELDGATPIPAILDPSLPYNGGTDRVDVLAKSAVKVPLADANPFGTTLTLAAAKGTFTGKVTLRQPDAVFGGAAGVLVRTATYQGILVKEGSGYVGVGYYLMPERPNEAGETVAKTPLISNQVILAP